MAGKKTTSRAEKTVSDAKKKAPSGVSTSKSASKKPPKPAPATGKKAPKVSTEYDNPVSSGFLTAFFSLVFFILFLIISINPEGALLQVVKSIVLGLIGQGGFYFSIPSLLYLFIIQTFSRKSKVTMRSFCVIAFTLLCGSIYHLFVQEWEMIPSFEMIKQLYTGGNTGTTGGVLCGGLAMLLLWACGKPLSFLITGTAAVLTLLGAMQITLPSIFRAIANRPRDDWDEEEDDYIEPAAIVVNHIANKQIQHKKQARERAQQARLQASAEDLQEQVAQNQGKSQPVQKAQKPEVLPEPQETVQPLPGKGASFMDKIDGEISAPLAASQEDGPVIIVEESEADEVLTPSRMPALDLRKAVSEEPVKAAPVKPEPVKKPKTVPEAKESTKEMAQKVAVEISQASAAPQSEYGFPPIDLLNAPVRGGADGTEEMRENSRRLNETLASFNIDAHIINVTRGPTVTRYEVELDKGVRLSKLTGCADDIALSLGASGVRIAAVPGKISVVGIEVPNRAVTTVSLREVIDSQEFNKAKSKTSISLGKSIDGNCVVGNIAKMPHLLIAGTTGSGKSVCMNSIIISLLYKAGPEDVKLIMVDPKMVELGIYNSIPHLLIPVVTDPKKAAGSLQWAVTEMLRRYKMMSDMGVRDLESYNGIVTSEEGGQKLPQVVIIIDELADLMMVAAKEVEDSICRIAQMGRAAGMHLIIATQRPSANVITGLMKANIPSRIAFSVASAMESRIILDTMGAEKLVGKGDMLYAPIGCGKPLRVQGCFVTDSEVERVAEYVKSHFQADYNQQVLEDIEKRSQQTGKKPASVSDPDPSDDELEGDEMLPAAVEVILETGQASVSMLQRRLKLGYARAARIVDEMEEKGIVGPFQGSKPRAILITKEQWAARQSGGEQMEFDDLDAYEGVPEEI